MTPRPTALVTGASLGIGLELARELARDGHDLVLLARSREALLSLARELEAAHGVAARVLVADLARPEACAEIVRQLSEQGVAIDVLVNNAGFGSYGPFAQSDLARELEMIQVNVTALVQLTRLLLPGMLERRRGFILNVASTAAFQPGPLMAVYYATKAFVLSFSDALRNELRGSGVRVTALCPGPTATGFQAAAGMQQSRLVSVPTMLQDAASVARAGYAGLRADRGIVVPGFANAAGSVLVRLLPRAWAAAFVRRIQDRRRP